MAPNLKRNQLILQTVDLDLIQPVKAGFPPLTSEAAQQQQAPQKTISEAADTSDYWTWSSENDAEINEIVAQESLSTDRIIDNILRQPAVAPAATSPANDQYWDWSHAKTESTDYWTWEDASEKKQIESTEDSDSYWAW